ncbi:MAG: hypothetical protein KZQ83_20530 [gamma proteobacterium symbiont of Taylorina sp.]|nr:hypothetical protein [gamma proteobacterium symbiont of Taylorina sp.]
MITPFSDLDGSPEKYFSVPKGESNKDAYNLVMERIEVLNDLLGCYLSVAESSDTVVPIVATKMIDSLLYQANAIMQAGEK